MNAAAMQGMSQSHARKTPIRGLVACLMLAAGALAQSAQLTVASYDMTNGGSTSISSSVRDDTYTGGTGNPHVDYSALAGGKGDLVDGITSTANWNTNPAPYVGWRQFNLASPQITFHFGQTVHVTQVDIYVNWQYSPGSVDFSLDGVHWTNKTYTLPLPPPANTWASFQNLDLLGDTIYLRLNDRQDTSYPDGVVRSADWIMIQEVVFTGDTTSRRALVPDGTSVQQAFSAYPDTRWFALPVEPGKTYMVEVADVDGDLTSNALGAMTIVAPDGVSAPPEASADCTSAHGPRPPAVDVAGDGVRCIVRTAPPSTGLLQNKRPVYVKVTRMDPAAGGGAAFRIRAREATVYGRWFTTNFAYHIEIENTTGDPMCVEVARYPASGLSYTPGPGWSGTAASFQLTVPAFGAVKQVITKNELVGTDSEGTLRIGACASPVNFIASALHVSTYAFDDITNQYIYFFTTTANDGHTATTW